MGIKKIKNKNRIMNQKTSIETVKGYFIAMGDERNLLKEKMSINEGRGGIFYKKEELIATITSKETLKKIPMDVVEITVPPCCITSPNCTKFGIKSGKNITIVKIQSFKKAMKEYNMV